MKVHTQTLHSAPVVRVQAQTVQCRPCANASAALHSSNRQRAFLGNTCSTSYRIGVSSRRIGAATLQAALDNYVADVPVAGQQVMSFSYYVTPFNLFEFPISDTRRSFRGMPSPAMHLRL